MSHISFRVVSIELQDSTFKEIDPNNQFRLNLTQRPHHIRQEFIVNNSDGLKNINHEWSIDNSKNQVEKVTLTLRTVQNKSNINDNQNNNNNSDDNYSSVNGGYVEPNHSLIGYCKVDIKNLHKN